VLDGVTKLSDDAFHALSQHVGYLHLCGLTSLSDEGATALSRHKGTVSLLGMSTISDEAVSVLRTNNRVFLPPQLINPKLP